MFIEDIYSGAYKISDKIVEDYNSWTRALSEHQLMVDKQLADSMECITYGAYERDEDICEEEEEW